MRGRSWIAFGVLVVVCVTPGSAATAPGVLSPQVLWVPLEYHTGGAYTAIQAAPDGAVYLGTTYYDGFARFLVLPPGGREFRLIADMASATGETSPGPYAQAKIHTKPAVAPDGRLYFGTKSGKPALDERWQVNYPGGHLLVYDPRSGQVADLGIPRARQSIIAVGVDRTRGLVYVLTDPDGHLFTYDPGARRFTDRGRLAFSRQPTRYLPVLGNGDVYHPAGAEAFMRYDAASGQIERIPLQFVGQGVYERSNINDGPYAMAVAPDGRRFHGVGQTTGQVYTFTPSGRRLTVEFHGAGSPVAAGRVVYYTITTAPDGHAYYTAAVRGESASGTFTVMRLNTRTGRPETVGRVGPLPAPPPGIRGDRLIVEGSTAGPDGTLYIMLAYPLRVLVFPRLAAP